MVALTSASDASQDEDEWQQGRDAFIFVGKGMLSHQALGFTSDLVALTLSQPDNETQAESWVSR